jgi:hypothetical protein
MSTPSGAPALDISIPGICQHLPLTPGASERVSIGTTTAGAEAHADLTIGFTLASGPVTLSGDEADAEFFEALAIHASRAAAWLRGDRRAA